MRKTLFVFIAIFITFYIFGQKSFENVEARIEFSHDYRTDKLEDSELYINRGTVIYKDLANLSKVRKVILGQQLSIIESDDGRLYRLNGRYEQLVRVKTDKKVTGWVKLSDIMILHKKAEGKLYGITQRVNFFEESNGFISYLVLVLFDGKKRVELPLFNFYNKMDSNSFIKNMLVDNIKLEELNGDDKVEIVLEGYYVDGLWATDAALINKSRLWVNYNENELYTTFNQLLGGSFFESNEWTYSYNYYDRDSDGIIDLISAHYNFFNSQLVELHGKSEEEATINYTYNYEWQDGRYILTSVEGVDN